MDVQSFGNLSGNLARPADGFQIKSLRRKNQRGVTRMHPGIFHVLRNGISNHLAFGSHGIDLDLFGIQ